MKLIQQKESSNKISCESNESDEIFNVFIMITDRNEAFKHNSCKKLAQLAKVIFTMGSQKRDRNAEMNSILNDYEQVIQQLVVLHNQKAQEISKNLIAFRKSCIDTSCKSFGVVYKKSKAEFNNMIKEQNTRFNQLIQDAQNLKKDIIEMNNSSKSAADATIKIAQEVEKDLQTKQKEGNLSNTNSAIKDILDSIRIAKEESEKRQQDMRAQHAHEITTNRKAINIFLSSEILKRKEFFQDLKNRLGKLKSNINEMRNDRNKIIESNLNNSKRIREIQKKMQDDTKNQCKSIASQIVTLKENDQEIRKKRKSQLSQSQKTRQTIKKAQQTELANYDKLIQDQIDLVDNFTQHKNDEAARQQQANESVQKGIKREFNAEYQRKQDELSAFDSHIQASSIDIHKIELKMMSSINESIDRVGKRSKDFHFKLEQQKKNQVTRDQADLVSIKRRSTERVNLFNSAIQRQIDSHTKRKQIFESEVKELKSTMSKMKSRFDKEINENNGKQKSEIDKYEASNQSRLEQKKNDLKVALTRKFAEKDKKTKELTTNFQKDYENKKTELKTELKNTLNNYSEEIQSKTTLKSEIEDNNRTISKLNAKLEISQKQIENLQTDHQKQMEMIQNDILKIEKSFRTLQRRIKKETQAIDEEYEMKIQMEQVRLQKTIENINKLYDNDENQRGTEIIESIRKVREVKNRTIDHINSKTAETLKLKKENDSSVAALKQQIEQFKSSSKEKELSKKYDERQIEMSNDIEQCEKYRQTHIDQIKERIQKQAENDDKGLQKIQALIEKDKTCFESEIAKIKEQEQEIAKTEQQQIEKIDQDFIERSNRIKTEHSQKLEKMKKRIEAMRNQQNDYKATNEKERSKVMEQNKNEIKRKDQENLNMMKQFSESRSKECSALDDKIGSLSFNLTKIEADVNNPSPRKSELSKIKSLIGEKEEKDSQNKRAFEAFTNIVEKAKNNKGEDIMILSKKFVRASTPKTTIDQCMSSKRHLPPLVNPI